MFSRSEKSEEATEAMAAGSASSSQRSPMILAALAGLLAIAGAFLLVQYLRGDGSEAASTLSDDPAATTAVQEDSQQVLIVTQTIPKGTSVRELVAEPTLWLSARAVPKAIIAESAITTIADLSALDGQVLTSDALKGDQLLRDRFDFPGKFDNTPDEFAEVPVPRGHHSIVMTLPAGRALGGNIAGDSTVSVIASLRIPVPGSDDGDTQEATVVVLPSVEVLAIQRATEIDGSLAEESSGFGIASRGSYVIVLAVEPDELTDLVYAMEYGEITLAGAIAGANNDDTPRAATTIDQILGDNGAFLAEVDDDSNLFDLLEGEEIVGESVEITIPDDDEPSDPDDAPPAEEAEADEAEEVQPGDS